jgi:hypothetical protein
MIYIQINNHYNPHDGARKLLLKEGNYGTNVLLKFSEVSIIRISKLLCICKVYPKG